MAHFLKALPLTLSTANKIKNLGIFFGLIRLPVRLILEPGPRETMGDIQIKRVRCGYEISRGVFIISMSGKSLRHNKIEDKYSTLILMKLDLSRTPKLPNCKIATKLKRNFLKKARKLSA